MEQFDNQNYLNIETYRKTGQVMQTPVWFVQDDNAFYIRTIANSGKVKRIRNDGRVRIMPCGRAGEPLGVWVDARAQEMTDDGTKARVRALLLGKYGSMVDMFEQQTRARGQEYIILKVELV